MYPLDAPEEKAEPDSSFEGIRESPVQVESAYPIQVNLVRLGLQGAGEERGKEHFALMLAGGFHQGGGSCR